MGFFGRKLTDQERAEELFSPYIDEQVTAEERRFLERYLAEHAESRAKFDMLKAAVQLTKTLPPVKAPRSFVLPRSMARQPTLRLRSGLALRLYPTMRFATVAVAALFVFALVGDLATQSRFAASPERQSVPLVALTTATAVAAQAPEASIAAEAPAPDEPMAEAAAPAPTEAPAPTTTATAASLAQALADTTTPPAPTQAPPAMADATAAGSGVVSGTPEAARVAPPAPTEGEPADLGASGDQNGFALRSAESPAPAQIDALRLAVAALAGLAVTLAVATLVLRQRAQ